ncbi:hypothetical protein CKN82_12590 [Carnobacterium divergens]|uniref:Ltp family lipoprotein n=2 Tax=Carnobacterium divergens TaxID=2748 RepID=A0AAW8RBQ3_CARDV|nr:Ltp family lipoprotein [Carnobacterium divergens]AOA00434.1 hypothetical protein BFC22_10050 [Carnobacterium divergens]MDT1959217.1 Ltp family lipoprotein [Carnobacterium divergens]MDT1975105.1 Ltp family lipoprotein [Carnobacterium divergens]MDT1995404.1 Ltp family lipoprotein [Carnobacterium divergens]TFI62194.1 hypothetical protein CKN59_12150 [Carnobacterium divergens]
MAKKIKDENGNVYVKKKPFYKKWWVWVIAVLVLFFIVDSLGGSDKDTSTKTGKTEAKSENKSTTDSTESNEPAPEKEVPVEYTSALKKANSYAKLMFMSKIGIQNQLTSEYGDKFSPEAAQYAIDNIKADWNENALKKAESYQKTMSMSPEAIRDQLTSEHGEQFTQEEADYAIQHLNK